MRIEKLKVNFQCPSCRFLNTATLRQFQIRDVIICRGCKKNIHLLDHFNTVKKGLRTINRTIEGLKKSGYNSSYKVKNIGSE